MPRLRGMLRGLNVYRPVLMIDVGVADSVQRVGGVLDSGADYTLVPGQLIEDVFDVPFEDLEPVPTKGVGVGGAFEMRICYGKIAWRTWHVTDWFLVAERAALEEPLLGREDFFRRFDVNFSWNHSPPFFDVDPTEESPTSVREIEDEEKRLGGASDKSE